MEEKTNSSVSANGDTLNIVNATVTLADGTVLGGEGVTFSTPFVPRTMEPLDRVDMWGTGNCQIGSGLTITHLYIRKEGARFGWMATGPTCTITASPVAMCGTRELWTSPTNRGEA